MTEPTEIFLSNGRYYLLVRCLRSALRRKYKHPDERSYAALSNLSLAGINMGELSLENSKVVSAHYRDLVEALATVQPCAFSGQIEDNEIITILGEVGNIWPAAIRADIEANRPAA
ncbi:MAG: hypothetical protein EOS81_07155 [Mesorhizobium sp.]|uniref:hypothetical protein n=1 Tax=unclassified Mesorhizobium TaxID=325217 RepID=UPI000F76274E|nr:MULTISPECIES: hypothetical protein [unclassified Mesorhizobium]RVC65849.1 hypothetical protein EN766_33930 [Mesorhizobium sp. M2A.F.Ca.ET.046.02.1.1]RVC66538.1 hypothetical protein EN759_18505 [Mesorhizobium sp. M00.F.Ca.ET.038.03.1.1]AZO38796.1 hypothetical protein EJ072_33320 [Mesorhizobium sp. M2A.F.Ca.ET.046.03.2.1]RWB43573.1 MAG: hypothetical protein EOQ44_18070 [Mesorhizobium sp.]RWE20396.1 MAG: hypothetical protein EOS76_08200 [Mesorhizobium sp.]